MPPRYYGQKPAKTGTTLRDYMEDDLKRRPKPGDMVALGPIMLVAHLVVDNHVTSIGLRLAEEFDLDPPTTVMGRLKRILRRLIARFG